MKRYLLDSSFLIDLLNERADRQPGPAAVWLEKNPRAQLWISPVTWAEVLEGAEDRVTVRAYLARFQWQGISCAHADKVAVRQCQASHRLGENDAWQISVAECLDAIIVGHDPKAFARLGEYYQDHRSPARPTHS